MSTAAYCGQCGRRTLPSVALQVEVAANAIPRSKERTTITVCSRCYRDDGYLRSRTP